MNVKDKETVYQLKISLIESKPKIWRRVLVKPDLLLEDLHKIIQTVMGWENYHLHQFKKDGILYVPESPEEDGFLTSSKLYIYSHTKVSDLLKAEKDKLKYEYDFGDSWEHEIVLEKILSLKGSVDYPVCTGGKKNCPPEDCGGIWGFHNILKILKDPDHKEYDENLEWMGKEYDPDYFNQRVVNARLKTRDYGCYIYE